jgi:hypothetical protein
MRDLLATGHLRAVFGGCSLDEITASSIRDFVSERRVAGMKGATINREPCVLSAGMNHVRLELEWDVNNPVAARKLREPEGPLRWLTSEEARCLIEAAGRGPQAHHLREDTFSRPYVSGQASRISASTTCAVRRVQSGVPLAEVPDVLGYSTVRMTERYAHLGPENIRAARSAGRAGGERSGGSAVVKPVCSVTFSAHRDKKGDWKASLSHGKYWWAEPGVSPRFN